MSSHPGDRLSAFLDGELSAAERAEVQGHLRECAACTRELEELGAVDAFARELPVEAPAGYFEELPGRVRARVRRPARAPRMALWAVAAAAAVMAVVVTPVVLEREHTVMTPAAQAVPEVPAPAAAPPATAPPLLQSVSPPASLADTNVTAPRAQPVPAKREADARLLEREKADTRAENSLSKTQAQSAGRRDAGAAPAAPGAAPAAAPPPAVAGVARNAPTGFEARDAVAAPTSTMAESVEVQAAKPDAVTTQEEARPEAGADAAKKERARPAERKLAAGNGAFAHPDDRALMTDKRYEALVARPAASAAEARALGEAWELFARDVSAGPRADEARVRAIESAVRAWTLGHDPADLARARARGTAYLEMENAPQAARVRTALAALP